MLLSTLVLGLSTCASALHARSPNGDKPGGANTGIIVRSVAPYPTKVNSSNTSSLPSSTGTPGSCSPYWLESIKHQGLASFNPNPNNYTVFRNVKDFGALGDGVTDDTAAIQRAVTQGNRCGPSQCESSTNTPALVYFPQGTYLISSSIIDYYYTQVCFHTLMQGENVFDIYSSLATLIASRLSLQLQISRA
jgi:hypothetical protein